MHRITEIEQTCSACPSQWEGKTSSGEYVYIRYRWGEGRIEVNYETVFEWSGPDGMGGFISLQEISMLAVGRVDFSEVI